MSSHYSSRNRFLVGRRGRPPKERWRRAESQEFNSCTETRSSNQFGGQQMIKREESGDRFARLKENSGVAQSTRYVNCHARPSPITSPATSSQGSSGHKTEESFNLYNRIQSRENEQAEPSSHGKEPMEAASLGVGPCSSSSVNASFSVLAANLPSNGENKPTQEYPEEENDGVRDIHVTVEELRADATSSNEMRRPARRLQPSLSDTSTVSFVSSDSESITLSREFANVLTAARISSDAVQTSDPNFPTENSSVRTPAMRSSHLPDIGEEESTRSASEEAGPDQNEDDVNSGNSNLRHSMGIVPTGSSVAEGNRDQISSGRGSFALVRPIDGSSRRTGFTSDRDAPPSFGDVHDNERYAIVESGNRNGQNIQRESFSSSARSNEYRLSTPKQLALQKVKREEIEAKAVAWEEAKMTKVENRFKKDEAIINAWENEQAVKANIKMKKVERKLEEKRATAFEKMQNEIAKNHRKAENRRAVAAARRGAARAKISEASDKIRSAGRFPKKFLLC